ncbi:GntR family transcriptional regulator [Ochrobactrum sp. Q0168]|uniref:GntR family transcriptional regulator n=1 Tax=Ochrobactrum sp. Q0168 TaxID=2793241 RepID=UPI0018EB72E8|nr:GntR family transcriptional regulator [Ochrobactrum sp. Q0168]
MTIQGKASNSARQSGLAEFVYGAVKERLLNGNLEPAQAVSVEALTEELDVSRQPVMGALKRLSVEGFVVIVPQVGCRVRQYSSQEVTDFFRLFAEGEALVAEFVAERASLQEINRLEVISDQIGRLRETTAEPDYTARQYRVLNRELHLEMRRISRSVPVAEVVETLGDRSDFFIAAARRPIFADRLTTAHDEHEEIIKAFRERDVATARNVMKTHILQIEQRLRGAFVEVIE